VGGWRVLKRLGQFERDVKLKICPPGLSGERVIEEKIRPTNESEESKKRKPGTSFLIKWFVSEEKVQGKNSEGLVATWKRRQGVGESDQKVKQKRRKY